MLIASDNKAVQGPKGPCRECKGKGYVLLANRERRDCPVCNGTKRKGLATKG